MAITVFLLRQFPLADIRYLGNLANPIPWFFLFLLLTYYIYKWWGNLNLPRKEAITYWFCELRPSILKDILPTSDNNHYLPLLINCKVLPSLCNLLMSIYSFIGPSLESFDKLMNAYNIHVLIKLYSLVEVNHILWTLRFKSKPNESYKIIFGSVKRKRLFACIWHIAVQQFSRHVVPIVLVHMMFVVCVFSLIAYKRSN